MTAAPTRLSRATLLPIVFEDDHIVAVHKPPGIMVHRSRMAAQDGQFVLQSLRRQLGRRVYAVHRLDRATSGVLLFGLNAEAAAALSQQFAWRLVNKTYLAVVRGFPAAAGVIDHAVATDDDDPTRTAAPKASQTRYRRLATIELPIAVTPYTSSRYALVELQPITGRRHQLRRHMKHLSHPIIGDTKYGKGSHNRVFREHFGCNRLLLACVELRFTHPVTGEPMTCAAPLSGDFASLLCRFNWQQTVRPAWLAPNETQS